MASLLTTPLATVAQLVEEQQRRPKLWRRETAEAAQHYLTLIHQQDSARSFYVVPKWPEEKIPLFDRKWLSARMTALENEDFLFSAARDWKHQAHWAHPRYYGAIVRSTVEDFIELNYPKFGSRYFDPELRERNLSVGLATKVRKCWQFRYSETGDLQATLPEYPGWMLDTLGH